jgi:hypothetical protein
VDLPLYPACSTLKDTFFCQESTAKAARRAQTGWQPVTGELEQAFPLVGAAVPVPAEVRREVAISPCHELPSLEGGFRGEN